MPFSVFLKNGDVLPVAEAVVSAFNIAYSYGFGVYETIRVTAGRPAFLGDHINRLINSAKILGVESMWGGPEFTDHVHKLTTAINKQNEPNTYNLKVLLIGGHTPAETELFMLPLAPLFPDKKLYTYGAIAMTVAYERLWPRVKSLNMLPSYLYYKQACGANGYDVLFIDKKGNIREGSRTNFFILKGRILITPPDQDVLNGVMRHHVCLAASKTGFTVRYEPITQAALNTATGAFLTSTSSKIMPLRQIDNMALPIGAELKELVAVFGNYYDTHAYS